ncbi:Tat pathway signal protein [Streptomyces sp. JNUCC 64]
MARNVLLAARLREDGRTQQQIAEALNRRVASHTGRYGKLLDRHIRNWVTGKTTWPQARYRRALEEEFGCTVAELGFYPSPPRKAAPSQASVEDTVKRRQFTASAGALAATTALPRTTTSSTPRIGMTDVNRLEEAFTQVITDDDARGGGAQLESRAIDFAKIAIGMQENGVASQRVRQRLYYFAAAFTGSALWAAIEDQATERARNHLDRAIRLAGMSGAEDIQLRLWGHAAFLFSQLGNPHDASAAEQAAKASPLCRRDPLYRSLITARIAGTQAHMGERTLARRSVEAAVKAFDRAEPEAPRAPWIAFFDRAELEGLSGLSMARLGCHDEAEAHFHRTLAQLRPGYERNRKYYTAQLALCQLRQGDVELACATASAAFSDRSGAPSTGRQRKLLAAFERGLTLIAPDARATTTWREHQTDERNSR